MVIYRIRNIVLQVFNATRQERHRDSGNYASVQLRLYGSHITKTRLYNFDPLKAHFYIVKLGFTGVYIIFFLFLLKNIDCGYLLEPPRLGGSNEYHNICFEQKYEKYQIFLFYLKF